MASKPKQTDTKLKKDVKNLKKKKYFHAKEKKGEKAKLDFAELKKKMSPSAKIWSIGNEWEFGGTKPTLNQAGRIREGVKTGGRVGLKHGSGRPKGGWTS